MSLNARRYEKGADPTPRKRVIVVDDSPHALTVADIEAGGEDIYRGLACFGRPGGRLVIVRHHRRNSGMEARCYMGKGHSGYPVCRWLYTGDLYPHKLTPPPGASPRPDDKETKR